jgi:hypothetical protein
MGPISFWNCQWLRESIIGRGSNLGIIPAELTVTDSFFQVEDLPECHEVVLVRVDLGTNTFADPVHLAVDHRTPDIEPSAPVAVAG